MEKKLQLQDLIDIIADKEKLTKKKSEIFIRTFFDVISQGLEQDKFVKIKNFGTFKLVAVGDRESININTGERFQINGHSKITFVPESGLKDLVNRPFSHFQTVVINEGTDIDALELVNGEMKEPEASGLDKDDELQSESVAFTESVIPDKENEENHSEEETCHVETEQSEMDNSEAETVEEPEIPVSSEADDIIREDIAVPEIEANAETPASQSHTISEEDCPKEDLLSSENQPEEKRLNYIYTEKKVRRETNWWKVVAILLVVFILMVLSYFAGYYRLFCPCEMMHYGIQPEVSVSDTIVQQKSQTVKKQTDTIRTDTVNQQIAKDIVPETDEKTESKKDTTPLSPSTSFRQIKGGKYAIIGTRDTYTVDKGETLRTIAEHVYGSKGFVQYIIVHNNISDPDYIKTGTVIQLPELERRSSSE